MYLNLTRQMKICITLISAALILIVAILAVVSGGKRDIKAKSRIYYQYFDTVSVIYDYSGASEEAFGIAADEFEARLERLHKLFDIYNEYEGMNNIATINRMAGVAPVEVEKEVIDLLEFAVEMYDVTDGNVNVAMGSVLSLWHYYREKGKEIPPAAELAEAAEHIDISKLQIDREAGTVFLSDPKASLDVGAIAKGYSAELIADQLRALGYYHYVIDLGGNLRAIGTKADGSSWRTGIQNPDTSSSEPYVYYLQVADTSVVTSGDYQRYYIVDGKKYHHIISKDTLMPAEYFSSVTVMIEDSGVADALSTALFNMSYEDGVRILASFDNVSVVWVTVDGQLLTYGLEE